MREYRWGIGLVLAAIVLIALTMPSGMSDGLKGFTREALSPLQYAVSGVSLRLKEAVDVIRGISTAALTHKELVAEVAHLRNDHMELERLRTENRALRRSLVFTEKHRQTLMPCEVIGRDISGWWRTIRVSMGRRHGVSMHDAVITYDGLIGKVIALSDSTADVLLIADPTCRIAGLVAGSGLHGVVYGQGTRRGQIVLRMDYLNKDGALKQGDKVFTSGLGGIFPADLLIGYIEEIYRDELGLYQYAELAPAASMGNIDIAFIIREEYPPSDEEEGRR